jgi:hypothetical protein
MKSYKFLLLILIFSFISGFSLAQNRDTLIMKDGSKLPCNIKEFREVNVIVEVIDENGIVTKKLKRDNIDKIIPFKVIEKPMITEAKIPTEIKDTLKYLITENAYLKSQISGINKSRIEMKNDINIGGNRISSAGYLMLGSLLSGVVSGVFYMTAYKSENPNTKLIFGYVFSGISAALIIAVPIQLISGGDRLKNIR